MQNVINYLYDHKGINCTTYIKPNVYSYEKHELPSYVEYNIIEKVDNPNIKADMNVIFGMERILSSDSTVPYAQQMREGADVFCDYKRIINEFVKDCKLDFQTNCESIVFNVQINKRYKSDNDIRTVINVSLKKHGNGIISPQGSYSYELNKNDNPFKVLNELLLNVTAIYNMDNDYSSSVDAWDDMIMDGSKDFLFFNPSLHKYVSKIEWTLRSNTAKIIIRDNSDTRRDNQISIVLMVKNDDKFVPHETTILTIDDFRGPIAPSRKIKQEAIRLFGEYNEMN